MGKMLDVANDIINKLKERNIDAYIWHKATTGSVYVRFKDNGLGSIRIGDHNGREKYRYKYNIRVDLMCNGWKKQNGIWRFYTNINSYLNVIYEIIKNREWRESKASERDNKKVSDMIRNKGYKHGL